MRPFLNYKNYLLNLFNFIRNFFFKLLLHFLSYDTLFFIINNKPEWIIDGEISNIYFLPKL